MKRKIKNLTEQFTDARRNYDRILDGSDKQLMTEQFPGVAYGNCTSWPCPLHKFRYKYPNCTQSGTIDSVWLKDHTSSGGILNIYGASAAFYTAIGSPQQGQFVNLNGSSTSGCWEYTGTNLQSPLSSPHSITSLGGFSNINTTTFSNCSTCQSTPPPVLGCTDSQAINFNSTATQDDGSCDYGWRCNEGKIAGTFGCYQGNATYPGTHATQYDCEQVNSNIPNGCGPGPACNKCCCDNDGQGGCVPGTEVYLIQNTNPCVCPAGMIDCGGKPPMVAKMKEPTDIERETMSKSRL